MRRLLIAWLKAVDYSKGYCPHCYTNYPGEDLTTKHEKTCIVKRTQDYLKRGQGKANGKKTST